MDNLMQKVKSSNIESIGYDDSAEVLYVKFKGGGLYSYAPCTQETFDKFKKAKSKGTWFHEHLRMNRKYNVTKLL